jgi:DNA topoisomerase IA
MAKSLVVVESPTKAKILSKYLGRNYQVLAPVGHLGDLPKSKLGLTSNTTSTGIGWPLATAGKNELNSQHNLPVPYAALMISTRKNRPHRGRWIIAAQFLP